MSTGRSSQDAINWLRNSTDPLKREAAAKELADDGGDASFDALVAGLRDPHLSVAGASAESLVARNDRRAIEPLIRAFTQAIDEDLMFEPGDIVRAENLVHVMRPADTR
jgi:HEAT repeat protein